MSAPTEAPRRAPWWTALLALAPLVAVYASGLDNGFVWLDQSEILEGVLIADDWGEALAFFGNDRNNAGYHRPLYSLMHSLDRALHGPDPRGFLLSSLVLQAANVLLVFALVRALARARWLPLVVAGLWGLHPVNSAVAGLIHSKADLLYVLGLLGAANLFVLASRAASKRARSGLEAGAALALGFSLLSKENGFVVAPALTALAWLPLRWGGALDEPVVRARLRRAAGVAWLPTLAVLALRFDALTGSNYPSELGLGERLLTFTAVYTDYLRRLALPTELSICDTVTRFSAWTGGERVRELVGFGLLVVLQVWAWVRLPWSRRWILLYHLALAPVAQVVPALHFRADRFLYLPSLAFVGFVADAFRHGLVERASGPRARRVALLLGGTLFAAAMLLASGRIAWRLQDFRNDETLFVPELRRTPDYKEGLSVLGRTYDRLGRHDAAGQLLQRALADSPGRVSFFDRGGTVLAYSFNLLARGELEEARAFLEEQRTRDWRPVHRRELAYNYAVVLFRTGEFESALAAFRAYLEENPLAPSAHWFAGRAARELGDRAAARASFREYLRLAPDASDRAEVEGWLEELGD